jgi:hypothetical protein
LVSFAVKISRTVLLSFSFGHFSSHIANIELHLLQQ